MKYLKLNDGSTIPQLGMGTWYLGEGYRTSMEEEQALCTGLDAGIALIDTAEMYGGGKTEALASQCIQFYA